MTVQVFLVGAGPGDPELLTLKAHRLLQEAEVAVVDRLVSPEILDLIPPGVSRIFAGKAPGQHHVSQDEINDMLVSLARSGRRVVRLKGGDPFIFGRGSEEASHLMAHGISFEVVPGITAAQGCGSALGLPLTHRGIATGVRFVTGHFAKNKDLDLDWQSLADPKTTLVVYMGVASIGKVADELTRAGLPASTPAAVIENGTTRNQRCSLTTLSALGKTVEEGQFKPPTLFVIGEVVRLAKALDWQGRIDDFADLLPLASGEVFQAPEKFPHQPS